MNIGYRYIEEEKLLIRNFSGNFSIEKYRTRTPALMQKLANKEISKVLLDFRNLEFDDSEDGYQDVVLKMAEIRKNIEKRQPAGGKTKHVFWVNRPFPTVAAHLFMDHLSDMKYNYCSSAKKVCEYLNLKISPEHLEEIVDNLKYT